jgi:hypothetical protein
MKLRATLAAVAALTLVTAASGQTLPVAKPAVVPFKLLPSRHMLIQVKVNEKGPYNLIFDTGAPLNIVTTKLGRLTGISKKAGGGGLFGMFAGGLNQVEIATVEVGEAKAEKVAAVVMDHPTVQAISDAFEGDHGRIDGIVGFPFFARFATTVDYQKRVLILTPTDYKPGNYIDDLTKTLTAASEKAGEPKVIGSAGLWGFAVEKGDDGVEVGTVYADSPAAKAGLKKGDRVTTIDGRWTDTVGDAHTACSLVRPGRKADITVTRDGKPVTVTVTPLVGF